MSVSGPLEPFDCQPWTAEPGIAAACAWAARCLHGLGVDVKRDDVQGCWVEGFRGLGLRGLGFKV